MGKKRRILTRTTKFAKKYFEFLDKVDGASNVIDAAEVDDVIERGDTFIDTITAVDNEDETVTVTGRVLGGGHTTGDLQISVNGGAFGSDFASTQDAGAGGLDEICLVGISRHRWRICQLETSPNCSVINVISIGANRTLPMNLILSSPLCTSPGSLVSIKVRQNNNLIAIGSIGR